ncbi:jg13401 [Pararge aegeria aegeria]|uniref:Jg13401 protein n=1 Tax=Pararge aegeria aegeria TaxID=348720 RepID=A0A8S4QJJ4_9NEOP|nr:jg13401 [Pararge aegeria aegeria]
MKAVASSIMCFISRHMEDGRWSFRRHFELLAPRLIRVAAALGRLLPNVGGPDSACRRLYSGIVMSMAGLQYGCTHCLRITLQR